MKINKYFTEEYGKIKLDKNCKINSFKVGHFITFDASFRGKGSKSVLDYQDKRMKHVDSLFGKVIVFKVINVEPGYVTVREVNPFTGKFYAKAPELKCHTWNSPVIYGSGTAATTHGDILPVGPWTIKEVNQKIYLGESYMNVQLGGCLSFLGYVDDVENGSICCSNWNNGKMIYQYACASAEKQMPAKLWKIKKTVKRSVENRIEM